MIGKAQQLAETCVTYELVALLGVVALGTIVLFGFGLTAFVLLRQRAGRTTTTVAGDLTTTANTNVVAGQTAQVAAPVPPKDPRRRRPRVLARCRIETG